MQEEFVKARKEAINHALARMKTLSGKGGMPVPEDENDFRASSLPVYTVKELFDTISLF